MQKNSNLALLSFMLLALILAVYYSWVSSLTNPITSQPLPIYQSQIKTKHVILMIVDGCGFNQFAAAAYYTSGQSDAFVFQKFPYKYAVSTFSAEGAGYDSSLAWQDFDYVINNATDSAAAATAMATGIKTYNGAIGVDINGNTITNITERAEELGLATGVVSSVQFSHATPAAFVAHNQDRNEYESIAQEMLFSSAVDVIMGACHPLYDNNGNMGDSSSSVTYNYEYIGGGSAWRSLVQGGTGSNVGDTGADADGDGIPDPWMLIQSRQEFQALANGPAPKRVCGLAPVYSTLQQSRRGDTNAAPYAVPLTDSVPTLAEMTAAALNVLDNDPDGLFLMVEGGAVDWAAHENQSGRLIEEIIDFSNAVQTVVNWVDQNSNWDETLLIVTADHETGYLTGPGSNPDWQPIVNNGINALPGLQWNYGSHTNSLVPLYAKGASAALLADYADETDPVLGAYLDNTEIAQLIFRILD